MNKALVVSSLFFFFHLVLAYYFDLIDDEAYYNLWSSKLSLGYYDHPPMIAWWISLGKSVFGETTLGVRFCASIAFFLVSILVARIAFIIGGGDRILISVILFNIMAPVMGLGFIATPDAPLILFWTCALWATLEGLFRKNPWYWILVGVFVSLAILSKFNALFYVVGLAGWCIFSKAGRNELKAPFIWLGVCVGVLLLLPAVYWNYQNDWVGLEKQFGRLLNEKVGSYFFLEFVLSIVIFATPLIFIFSVLGVFKKHEFRDLLLWAHLPLFIYFLNHSFTERIQGNWIITVFPWLAILAAVGLQNLNKVWSQVTIFTGSFLTMLTLVFGLNSYIVVFSGDNPFNQMKGWQEAKVKFQEQLEEVEWIAVTDYSMVGRLTWLLGTNDKVWALNEPYRYLFRGGFPSDFCATPGILIQKIQTKNMENNFVELTSDPIIYISRYSGEKDLMRYQFRKFRKVNESAYCG